MLVITHCSKNWWPIWWRKWFIGGDKHWKSITRDWKTERQRYSRAFHFRKVSNKFHQESENYRTNTNNPDMWGTSNRTNKKEYFTEDNYDESSNTGVSVYPSAYTDGQHFLSRMQWFRGGVWFPVQNTLCFHDSSACGCNCSSGYICGSSDWAE